MKTAYLTVATMAFVVVGLPSAHAQTCSNASLNGKYVFSGSGKLVTLNLLGVVAAQQQHNTVGYVQLNGDGQVSDGKTEEELDLAITEHSGVSGTYNITDATACEGTLTLTASNYQRTFQVLAGRLDATTNLASSFTMIPTGNAGETESYHATLSNDPPGGCTQAILPSSGLAGAYSGAQVDDLTNIPDVGFAEIISLQDSTASFTDDDAGTISQLTEQLALTVNQDRCSSRVADS